MPATRTMIRQAFRQLLIDEEVLTAERILLGNNNNVSSPKLPVITIRPSGGSSERSSVDSYDDTFSLTIEAHVKHDGTTDEDTQLEQFEQSITSAIRTGPAVLNALLHEYLVTNSSYEFDSESKDKLGTVTIEVECMIKP